MYTFTLEIVVFDVLSIVLSKINIFSRICTYLYLLTYDKKLTLVGSFGSTNRDSCGYSFGCTSVHASLS